MTHRPAMKRASGFSLIEMAVVLFIVVLLLGGLLVPFATQVEQRRIAETQKTLEEIKGALIGFAIVNGRLPCPDTTGDGQADACAGILNTSSTGGNLPWVTLGVASADPWGRPFQYRVNDAYANAATPFTLNTSGSGAGILRVCTDSTCGAREAENVPAVIYSTGKNGGVQPPAGANELENTTVPTNVKFDRNFVNHVYVGSGAGEFDDLVTWLSPNILFNRMVAAQRLP